MAQMSAENLPPLFREADLKAVRYERRSLVGTATRLVLAVVAAVFASIASLHHHAGLNVLGLAAAGAFAGALVAEIWLINEAPEHAWYENRAVAESARSLAWRFSVGGFPYAMGSDRPESCLAGDLADLLRSTQSVRLPPANAGSASEVMLELRASPLEERRRSYVEGRVLDQMMWYGAKADKSQKRAETWRLVLIVTEVAGMLAAIATGTGYLDLDLTSIISTMLGCSVAWLAVKQHDALARAYTLAAHELASEAAQLNALEPLEEAEWAEAVDEAEEAISREHATWRAARLIEEPNGPSRRERNT